MAGKAHPRSTRITLRPRYLLQAETRCRLSIWMRTWLGACHFSSGAKDARRKRSNAACLTDGARAAALLRIPAGREYGVMPLRQLRRESPVLLLPAGAPGTCHCQDCVATP